LEWGFRKTKIKYVMPLFTGVFCSLFICAFISSYSGYFKKPAPVVVIQVEKDDLSTLFAPSEVIPDPVLEYYRNPDYKEWVINFFTDVCMNYDIAYAILDCSDEFNIPPALAFALCWEESRFNPSAVNRQNRNGSIDRGLFQLNNQSFPHLEISVYYNIRANTRYGISHLRQCLNSGGTEISALAMYNAGAGRVRTSGAPEVTLNYISRILENRRKIESRFHSRLIREEEFRMALKELMGEGR